MVATETNMQERNVRAEEGKARPAKWEEAASPGSDRETERTAKKAKNRGRRPGHWRESGSQRDQGTDTVLQERESELNDH